MNIPFRISGGDKELEAEFVEEAKKVGMIGVKGHRSVGGIRISLYNAITVNEVERLVSFMKWFQEENIVLEN